MPFCKSVVEETEAYILGCDTHEKVCFLLIYLSDYSSHYQFYLK